MAALLVPVAVRALLYIGASETEMVAIPHSAGDINVDWLRASLRPGNAAAFSNLTSVSVERLGEGVALSTDIYRLKLGYAAGAQAGPATLVAKLPSSSPEVREIARGWRQYRREVLFYRDIAATVVLRTPRTYVAEFDPETDEFVLVMEDLSPAMGGNQIVGLPLDYARLALEEVADLHASWWSRPELVALEATIQLPALEKAPGSELAFVTAPPGPHSRGSSPFAPRRTCDGSVSGWPTRSSR